MKRRYSGGGGASAGVGTSPAFDLYMAGKITSQEYFARVRGETEKTVRSELKRGGAIDRAVAAQ